MAPRTSVLLPVRNGSAWLDTAVASVLAQTDGDLELVVVDDGSSDDTAARLSVWSSRDSRVRILSLPPTGLVGALNAGLEVCRGRWVARMDADDVADPHRLEHQLPLLMADPGLGVVDGQVAFIRDGESVPLGMRRYEQWINGVVTPEDFDRELLVESPVVHPAATFPRALALDLGGYREGPFPEDYDLWLRMHAMGRRLCKVPKKLVDMRDRPERLTRTDPRYDRSGFRRARQSWLAATVLQSSRRVVLWGAGRNGRPWLRWLQDCGHVVPVVVDVDERKWGTMRRGVPISGPTVFQDVSAEFALVAVGVPGAHQRVRDLLSRYRPDWIEGRHWWMVCRSS